MVKCLSTVKSVVNFVVKTTSCDIGNYVTYVKRINLLDSHDRLKFVKSLLIFVTLITTSMLLETQLFLIFFYIYFSQSYMTEVIRMRQFESVNSKVKKCKIENCTKQNIAKASCYSSPFHGDIYFSKEMISNILQTLLCQLVYI